MSKKTLELENANFADMTEGQLKEYASLLRLPFSKDSTRQELIEAISKKQKGRAAPSLSTNVTTLKPGYSRIRIDETLSSDKQMPVYINDNGNEMTIPRGVPVVVANRIVQHLRNSTVRRRRQQEGEPGRPPVTTFVDVPQYPFQVLESEPGPQVKSKREIAAEKNMGPKMRYRELFGRWPRPREMTRAIEAGLLKLHETEELPDSEQKALDKERD